MVVITFLCIRPSFACALLYLSDFVICQSISRSVCLSVSLSDLLAVSVCVSVV